MNLDDGLLYTHIELKLTQLNELRTRKEGEREKEECPLLVVHFPFLFCRKKMRRGAKSLFNDSLKKKSCAGGGAS